MVKTRNHISMHRSVPLVIFLVLLIVAIKVIILLLHHYQPCMWVTLHKYISGQTFQNILIYVLTPFQVVSASLAGGELKSLDGLVDRQTLNDLKNTIGKMSVAQRYDLMVQKEDIYFSFPYQVRSYCKLVL